ncbi:competence protein ComFA [Weissella uvarum]|uniref:helicase-related protein n=1 Tax=Weissella uvarum TaxID=1479233 RepID=UPI00195F99A8|nr:helicase-related protein [Weissella uvarum]MBM7617942.1 competence protein ComFA [Weissella uvarum]MCM0596161.1 DEAD/DEAH box helicase family protein [Weissella uvarum]
MEKYGRLEATLDNNSITGVAMPAIRNGFCQRCAVNIKDSWRLPSGLSYCWHCAKYGRLTEQHYLYGVSEPHKFDAEQVQCTWSGKLTTEQSKLSEDLLEGIKAKQDQLIFAVTGAGKTEMLYSSLTYCINKKFRIAYLSPRIDVVQEIAARIMKYYDVSFTMLHGEIKDTFQYQQITFASVHQMYKFYHAFDLIVVDEADAFPLSGDSSLWYALAQARSDQSVMIYMTATLSQDLKKLMERKQLQVHTVLKRFHGQDLPNFKLNLILLHWKKRLPLDLKHKLSQKKAPWLIFVPVITDLARLKELLEHWKLGLNIVIISSKHGQRRKLVEAFKVGTIDVVCTTIILERGLTIPNVQVCILGVEDGKYTDETLLQIAGRSGRDPQYPDGNLIIYCQELTKQMQRIVKTIDDINRNRFLSTM